MRLPRHFALVFVLAAAACLNASDDLATKLDATLSAVYKPNEPGAAVLVIKNGQTILRRGYGLAEMELGVPIAPDMRFRIGSVTKQFTSVAILKLVEQGKIAFDDDITKYLPDYPTRGKRITIEHLLTHTSGIPSYTGLPAYRRQVRQDVTPDDIIAMTKDMPLEFEPGAGYAYNNTGYVLLGKIIEKVSGMKYAAFLKQQLFDPAGMTATQYDSEEELIPKRAHGYSERNGTWINAPYLSMTQPFSAGGLVSTVDDLAKWNDALLAGKIVKPALLARAQKSYVLTNGAPTRYGYGWGLRGYAGKPVIEHGGGIHGFLSHVAWLPEEKVFIALLTNANRHADASAVAVKLTGIVMNKPFNPKTVKLEPATLAKYAGMYATSDGRKAPVAFNGTILTLQLPGGPRLPLEPTSENEFLVPSSPFTMRFDVANGVVNGFTFDGPGPLLVAKRVSG